MLVGVKPLSTKYGYKSCFFNPSLRLNIYLIKQIKVHIEMHNFAQDILGLRILEIK